MKKVLLVLLFCIVSLGLWQRSIISYLWMQGKGQFIVIWNAQPIDELMADSLVTTEIKDKIRDVVGIQQFAERRLGLLSEGKYDKVYDQKGKDILWNLTASEPYELKSKEWYFPIVGSVSYKGFFDLNRAHAEQQELADLGYDTRVRAVGAWSTLGWFDDPILSNVLSRDAGQLAELMIHEITHLNVFIKDSLMFNENLASFIGEQGARQYLIEKYGITSDTYLEYINSEHDYTLFSDHVLNGKKHLEILYSEIATIESVEKKQALKNEFMMAFKTAMDTIPFSDKNRFAKAFKDGLPNNTFFMSFDLYGSLKADFAMQLDDQFNGDLKAFIVYYKDSFQSMD